MNISLCLLKSVTSISPDSVKHTPRGWGSCILWCGGEWKLNLFKYWPVGLNSWKKINIQLIQCLLSLPCRQVCDIRKVTGDDYVVVFCCALSSIEDSVCYPSYRWFCFTTRHESVRRHPVTTGITSRKRRPLTLVSDGTRTHFRSQRLVSIKIISYRSLLFPLFCMTGESLLPMTGSWCLSLRRTDILLLWWLPLFSDDLDGDSSSYVPLRRLFSESTSQQKINNNSYIEMTSPGWADLLFMIHKQWNNNGNSSSPPGKCHFWQSYFIAPR